jgi:hypothetical protein
MTEKKIIPDLLSVVIFPISKMLKLEFANSQLEIDLRTGLSSLKLLSLQLAPKFST